MQLTATIAAAKQQRKLGRDREVDLGSSAVASSSKAGGGGVDMATYSSSGAGSGAGVGVGGGAGAESVAMMVVEDDVDVREPVPKVAANTDNANNTAGSQVQPQAQLPTPPSRTQSSSKLSFSEELQCPVCFDLLATPALFPECGHVFCCRCAFMSVQTNREECPQCRAPVKTDKIVRLYTMDPLCAKAAVGLWGSNDTPTDPDHISWITRRDEGVKLFSGEMHLKNKKQKRNQHVLDFPPPGMGFAPPPFPYEEGTIYYSLSIWFIYVTIVI